MSADPLSFDAIATFVRQVVRTSLDNRLHMVDDGPIFGEPLLGVADGDDSLFLAYKTVIGTFHLTPREVLDASPGFGLSDVPVVRVLCWVLPISEATRLSNRQMQSAPSERWARTRYYGEMFNDSLRREVERYIRGHGALAVAPVISPLFRTVADERGVPRSTWSERHALYAAGLGTFGLCDGFITAAGKAMRCGSVVTNAPLPVTPREFTSHTEACPYLSHGDCGECIDRCPAGAIGPAGHDKELCKRYQDETLARLQNKYGVENTGCGLCQTAVPCESSFPD